MDVSEEVKFLWKFKTNCGGLVGGVRGVGLGGVRVDVRIEVFVEIKKKNWGGGSVVGGSGWGV